MIENVLKNESKSLSLRFLSCEHFNTFVFVSLYTIGKMLQVTQRNISYNIKERSTSQLEMLPMNIVDLMRQNIVDDFLFYYENA